MLDPLTIAGLISAGSGILSGLFGNEPDMKNYTREDLIKMGYKDFDPTKAKGDLARLISSKIKDRRNVSSSRASRQGVDDPNAVFSNESDLHDAEVLGRSRIDETDRQEENSIAQMLFGMNANADMFNMQQPSTLENVFSGAIIGGNIGLNVADVMQKADLPSGDNKPLQLTDSTKPKKPKKPDAPLPQLDNNLAGNELILPDLAMRNSTGLTADNPFSLSNMGKPNFKMPKSDIGVMPGSEIPPAEMPDMSFLSPNGNLAAPLQDISFLSPNGNLAAPLQDIRTKYPKIKKRKNTY